jgi:prephenate dehydrogenase
MKKFTNINFIGGHPMAGSEKTGYKSAKEYLFENAFYILAPSDNTTDEQLETMKNIAKYIGATPVVIDSDKHDYSVAAISHAPHIIASALVNTVKKLDDDDKYMHTLAAGGFKDITRIASSSPEVWTGICSDNREKIITVLDAFIDTLENVKEHIENKDDISSYFETAREYRNSFDVRNANTVCNKYDIYADVTDQPGAIASIATVLSVNGINIKNIGVVNNREYNDGVLHIVLDNYNDKQKSIEILSNMNYTIYNK